MSRFMFTVVAAASLLTACGPSATGPYAGFSEYRSPGGEYILRYLAPPWEWHGDDGGVPIIEIPAPRVDEFGIDAMLVPAKYHAEVTLHAGTAQELVDLDLAAAAINMEMVTVPPRAVQSDSGDTGLETVTERAGLNPRTFRRVAFTRPAGGAIHLVIQSSAPLTTLEVDRMVAAFDVLEAAP